MAETQDHGGNLDAAIARFGGDRAAWCDLSTGINPVPYPVPKLHAEAWTALPDKAAVERLVCAARSFWRVPQDASILASPGASALIARLPLLQSASSVHIPGPTYNEHAAAFAFHGWDVTDTATTSVQVHVHPNNPDGRLFTPADTPPAKLTVIDESFCDLMPNASLIAHTAKPGTIILKSFGKFWGLAGLRLGFAIGHPETLAALGRHLGPWPVSGPALQIGAHALINTDWAADTRARLQEDSLRLDRLMIRAGAKLHGGTDLFRLYRVDNAATWQDRLARGHIWTRIFPYSENWIRLGLPAPLDWPRIETAL